MKLIVSVIAAASMMWTLQGVLLTQSAATVAGVVLDDATGETLAGVQVALVPTEFPNFNFNDPPPVATTDAEGRFSLVSKRTGGFRVVPTKTGFIFYRESYRGTLARIPGSPGIWVNLTANTPIGNLELRMGRPAVISGRVLDAEGQRLPPNGVASLSRFTYDKNGKYMLGSADLMTSGGQLDDRGGFRLYGLVPGEYYLGIGAAPGQNIVGGLEYLYYPSLSTDKAKAVPIQVRPGEEVDVGTLQLSPRQKTVEFRVRFTAPVVVPDVFVEVGSNGFSLFSQSNSAEKLLRILPGHYSLSARDNSVIPEYYASTTFHVFDTDIVQDLVLKPTLRVMGTMSLENSAGELTPVPPALRCMLDGNSRLNCLNSRVVPGLHQLDFEALPPDIYVRSVTAGDRDILTNGLNITADTELEITLGHSDAVISGTARAATGEPLINGSVILVPDPPYRGVGLRYYKVMTDPNGQFEIHGIAPGSYKLFAWTELEGAAFRNAEFMKEFDDRGKPINVDQTTRQTVDLTAF